MTHRLTFLRHGQSVANRDGIAGAPDFFRARARAKPRAWGPEPLEFDLILSSPLKRASETASILSDHLGVPIELEPQWVERDLDCAGDPRTDFLGVLAGARPPSVYCV
jgi:2,3-bisphosphoglycerate-dependent phosphoglycerate mutase